MTGVSWVPGWGETTSPRAAGGFGGRPGGKSWVGGVVIGWTLPLAAAWMLHGLKCQVEEKEVRELAQYLSRTWVAER